MEGFTIASGDNLREIVLSSETNRKVLVKGVTGSGKTGLLIERYRYLTGVLNVPSEKILVLLNNQRQCQNWLEKVYDTASGTIWCTTYYNFVQKEITTYYPLILKKCNNIYRKELKPKFLSYESSRFLISEVVERQRHKLGRFSGLTCENQRLAAQIIENLSKAILSDIPFNEIGDRLFNSLELKDETKRQLYRDADEVIKAYRSRCYELGVFDMCLSAELYNTYLLRNPDYVKALHDRTEHLIVDDVQDLPPAALELIELMLENAVSCFAALNTEGGFGEYFAGNSTYIREKLQEKLQVNMIAVNLNKSFTCSSSMYEFSDMLYENIQKAENKKITGNKYIERNPPAELRSEMLDQISERIKGLIREEGYKPSDIFILSTFADTVTELVIKRSLKRYGIVLKNLINNKRLNDNGYVKALIALAVICHPDYGIYCKKDYVKTAMRIIFKLDAVRSSLLAAKITANRNDVRLPPIDEEISALLLKDENAEKYRDLKEWTDSYIEGRNKESLENFFSKAFLILAENSKIERDDYKAVESLIRLCRDFTDVCSGFLKNSEKCFIKQVEEGMKAPVDNMAFAEKLKGDYVLLGTPKDYFEAPIKRKIVIIAGLSSRNWVPALQKELSNCYVLSKNWRGDMIYTDELNEQCRKNYIASLLRQILKYCGEKLITFESVLSASGFENDGPMGEFL